VELDVLHEDNHLLVVNKPAGALVQGDQTGDVTLLDSCKNYIKHKYHKPGAVFLGVVHRLDRPTSGALIYARTSKAAARLSEQFREHRVHKTYWALVKQPPEHESGTLVHYLKKNGQNNRSYAVAQPKPDHKKAILHYRIRGRSDRYTLLEIELETGRHHQIRCQLAAIGSVIKGDLKYGADRSNPDGSISLHARTLAFDHPTLKTRLTLTAPVPNDPLWKFFEEPA